MVRNRFSGGHRQPTKRLLSKGAGGLLILLAATVLFAADSGSTAPASRAVVQATATVRIVSGARINWDKTSNNNDLPVSRNTVVQTENGSQPARLIEFE